MEYRNQKTEKTLREHRMEKSFKESYGMRSKMITQKKRFEPIYT